MNKRDSFRMMVWLVTYYEFFLKGVGSEVYCYLSSLWKNNWCVLRTKCKEHSPLSKAYERLKEVFSSRETRKWLTLIITLQ